MSKQVFVVDRKSLRIARWTESETAALGEGEVRLRVDSFALTSNNITYAAFGDAMNYWSFFPTGAVETGCIPVWGFAEVIESDCAGVEVGERLYGYYPMATEVIVKPARLSEAGFTDDAVHRRNLPAVYNQYRRCATDPDYRADREAEQALLRPLFITSFLIDDFLADNGFFGARSVVMSSASSKTAYGTAFCLGQRRATSDAAQVVGLTASANLAFVEGMGCYDMALAYDALGKLAADAPTVYVDFSGDAALRRQVHEHYGDSLVYSCSVGGTHWQDIGSGKGLPGPAPTLFFAPSQIKKRLVDWGGAGFQQRTAGAWAAFMQPVTGGARPWLQVIRQSGPEAIEAVYRLLLDGKARPQDGHMLKF